MLIDSSSVRESDKSEAEIQKEIQALIRQITVTVTILPLLKEPGLYISLYLFIIVLFPFIILCTIILLYVYIFSIYSIFSNHKSLCVSQFSIYPQLFFYIYHLTLYLSYPHEC